MISFLHWVESNQKTNLIFTTGLQLLVSNDLTKTNDCFKVVQPIDWALKTTIAQRGNGNYQSYWDSSLDPLIVFYFDDLGKM